MASKSNKVESRRGFLKFVGLLGATAVSCGLSSPLLSAPTKVAAPTKLLNGDCWIPELWAKESLKILEENMVMGEIVHRDFASKSTLWATHKFEERPTVSLNDTLSLKTIGSEYVS